tara:strand:+ start:16412 stop:16792 length:381 start_codon:yes stop_codon:yes gene_type:complete
MAEGGGIIPNSQRQTSGIGKTEGDDTISTKPLGDNKRAVEPPQQAPLHLPYEINTVSDELGDLLISLAELRGRFKKVRSHPNLSESQHNLLEKIDTKIEAAGKVIAGIAPDLDHLAIGAGQYEPEE